jgi:hypothetical protein
LICPPNRVGRCPRRTMTSSLPRCVPAMRRRSPAWSMS